MQEGCLLGGDAGRQHRLHRCRAAGLFVLFISYPCILVVQHAACEFLCISRHLLCFLPPILITLDLPPLVIVEECGYGSNCSIPTSCNLLPEMQLHLLHASQYRLLTYHHVHAYCHAAFSLWYEQISTALRCKHMTPLLALSFLALCSVQALVNTRHLTLESWTKRCSAPEFKWLHDYARFHIENRDKPDAKFLAYVSPRYSA